MPPLDRALPPRAEAIYGQLAQSTDAATAMDVVTFMAPLWRLAGNPAFEQSQQFIFDRLAAAGLQPKYEAYPNSGQGWEYVRGTVQARRPGGRDPAVAGRRIACRSRSIRSARRPAA